MKHYETILTERIIEHLPKVNRPRIGEEQRKPRRKGR